MDEEYVLLQLFALPAAFLAALLSLWTAWGRGHWFWRALPLVAWLSLLAYAQAHELVLMFTAQFLATLLLIGIGGMISHLFGSTSNSSQPSSHWQFTLRDAFLLVILAAMLMLEMRVWVDSKLDQPVLYLLAGATAGLATALAAWAAFGSPARLTAARRWWRYLQILLVFIGCGAYLQTLLSRFANNPYGTASPPVEWQPFAWTGVYTFLFGLGLMSWLLLAVFVGWDVIVFRSNAPAHNEHLPRKQSLLKILSAGPLLFSATIAILIVVGTYWQFVRPVPMPPTLPGPDNFSQLEEISKQLNWTAIPNQDYDVATPQMLQSFVTSNSKLLADARQVLSEPGTVNLTFDSDPYPMLSGVTEMRSICRSFAAQALEATGRNDFDTAVQANVDSLRLNCRALRGGLIVHRLVGHAVEGVGLASLAKIWPQLNRDQCRQLMNQLDEIEKQREPIRDVMIRDSAWEMNIGWFSRLYRLAEDAINGSHYQYSPIEGSMKTTDQRELAMLRLLRTTLALRIFQLEQGHLPTTLDELVPTWLAAVPIDPFNDQPLVYRRKEDGFDLYSVGQNRVDDGGKKVTWTDGGSTGDLFLDIWQFTEQAEKAANQSSADATTETNEETPVPMD